MDSIRSDQEAIKKYMEELTDEGYTNIKRDKRVDITAVKNKKTYYFEIKMTSKDKYFGAATLTEWMCAIDNKKFFHFVIAKEKGSSGEYEFIKIQPDEFMNYSSIPPFKIYFNIDLVTRGKRITRKSPLTEESLKILKEAYIKVSEVKTCL